MAQRWGERFPALLTIALPVLAGLAYMATGGAPQHYRDRLVWPMLARGVLLLAAPDFLCAGKGGRA